VFTAFGFCVAAAMAMLCAACGQGALSAPQRPARDIETRVLPVKPRHEIPRLIACPPAYGNKIVMARANSDLSEN
jgi:hypothetical protein